MTTIENAADFQEPEGIDAYSGSGWGEYPLDSVFVRTETRSVSEVVKRIESQRYVLDPDFQREFVWANQKQSKLIESCVMRIPLPVFYVAEAPDGRIVVVDGLQRLTTFTRFLSNHLRLTGLAGDDSTGSHALEGKYFKDLPISLQERVEDTQLTMYILDAKAPERARLDIFERVNSGEPLTRQQMRNALYNGPATIWLKESADGQAFQLATGRSLNSKAMRDREAINRFCAFKLLGRRSYTKGDMDPFLADGLNKLATLASKERADLREMFDMTMELNRRLFGVHAFRKSLGAGPSSARSVINISLFEVCAVTMCDESVLVADQSLDAPLKSAVMALLHNDVFVRAISSGTSSTESVQTRFAAMEHAISLASGK